MESGRPLQPQVGILAQPVSWQISANATPPESLTPGVSAAKGASKGAAARALPALLTSEFLGRDSGRVRVSLQLHMKDMSGTLLRPRGPVMNSVGRRELGKSILENKNHTSRLLRNLNLRMPSRVPGRVKTALTGLYFIFHLRR